MADQQQTPKRYSAAIMCPHCRGDLVVEMLPDAGTLISGPSAQPREAGEVEAMRSACYDVAQNTDPKSPYAGERSKQALDWSNGAEAMADAIMDGITALSAPASPTVEEVACLHARIVAVVRAAWSVADGTEHRDGDERVVDAAAWDELSAALSSLKSLGGGGEMQFYEAGAVAEALLAATLSAPASPAVETVTIPRELDDHHPLLDAIQAAWNEGEGFLGQYGARQIWAAIIHDYGSR